MVDFSVDVEGLRDLENQLLELGANIGAKEMRGALNVSGKIVLDAMREGVPKGRVDHSYKVDGKTVQASPGHLQSKIKRSSRLNKKGINNRNFRGSAVALVRIGVRKVPYVAAVEFGTDSPVRTPHPFIRKALLDNVGPVVDRFGSELRRRILKHVSQHPPKARR